MLEQGAPDFTRGDSYRDFAGLADSLGQNIVQNREQYGTRDSIAGALISGLIGGGFQGLSNDYQAGQKANYRDVLMNSFRGNKVAAPDGMDPSLFDAAISRGSMFNTLKGIEDQSALAKYQQERMGKVEDALLGRGQTIGKDGKPLQLFDPAIDKARAAAAETAAKLGAEDKFYNQPKPLVAAASTPEIVGMNADGTAIMSDVAPLVAPPAVSANPNSPQYKTAQDKIAIERTLSNDFNARASDFKYKEQGLKALTQAYLDPSGTSDFEIIRRGAQMVEPGLAVRSDDQESLRGAASALGMSYQAVQNAISGDSKLTPEVRAGIMRIGKRGYEASLGDYNTTRDTFIKRASNAGLDPKIVVPYDVGRSFDELYPNLRIDIGGTKATAPTGASGSWGVDPKIASAAQSRGASLAAQGKTAAEIASALRKEFGGK